MTVQLKRVFLLILPIVLFSIYLTVRHIVSEMKWERSQVVQHKLEGNWSNSMVGITVNPSNLVETVRLRLGQQEGVLDPVKSLALARELAKMFAAYNSGSSNAFTAFRFPPAMAKEARWDERQIEFEKQAMEYNNVKLAKPTGDSYSDNVVLTGEFFDWSSRLKTEHGEPRWCTACWTSMASDTIKVVLVESKSDFVDLQQFVTSEGNINFTHVDGVVSYSTSEILKRDKVVQFAEVAFTVRANTSLTAFRLYVSFFWDPGSEEWIPQQMILPIAPTETATLLF